MGIGFDTGIPSLIVRNRAKSPEQSLGISHRLRRETYDRMNQPRDVGVELMSFNDVMNKVVLLRGGGAKDLAC